jgi:hypothetical protein
VIQANDFSAVWSAYRDNPAAADETYSGTRIEAKLTANRIDKAQGGYIVHYWPNWKIVGSNLLPDQTAGSVDAHFVDPAAGLSAAKADDVILIRGEVKAFYNKVLTVVRCEFVRVLPQNP